jgi:hypothetical protein
MKFRPLDPKLVMKLLETEKDELSGPATDQLMKIKGTACPRCSASMHPRLHPQPFTAASPLPRLISHCPDCDAELTAEGLVIDRGNPAKVEDPLPVVRKD